MEKIYSLINFIKAYYPDSNIPMYLFSDEKCIFCMPEQNELTHPPFQYLRELFSGSDRITYCTTEYGIMFCSLRLNHWKNSYIVFGPITTVPYSDSDLQHLYKDYMVSNDSRLDFNSFLRQIPFLKMMLRPMPLFFWKKLIIKRKMSNTTRHIFLKNSF